MDKKQNNEKDNQEKAAQNPGEEKGPVAGETLEESVSEIVGECVEGKDHKQESHQKHAEHGGKHHADHHRDEEEIKKLKEEIEGLKDSRLRLLAEFDNYKRRTARETMKIVETANESVIKSILPVLENFERALHPDHKDGDAEALLKGIELIYSQFFETLKKAGLTEYNPVGEEFSSEKHEAMMHIESPDVPENKIIQVYQKGYLLNNKMIQYAKVSVSKGNGKA
jgi:molecular chaperone GrpE